MSVSATTTYATAAPYDSVDREWHVRGPGNVRHARRLDQLGRWSAPTLITLPPGSYAFSVPHDYKNPSAGRYAIGVTLNDSLGETAFAQADVAISNPPPVFAAPGLVLNSSSIDEGGTVAVSGTVVSPGGLDTDTVSIDWGDGSTPDTIVLNPGVSAFSRPIPI